MSLQEILKQVRANPNGMNAMAFYAHIPFCRFMCHYCDFAKTANFTSDLLARYMVALNVHAQTWLRVAEEWDRIPVFSSVFFGGGTPSLLGLEYVPLMAVLRPHLAPQAEVTLEANPDDLTEENLNVWRDLGFNRLSIGVQTFEEVGLSFLKRTHRSADIDAGLSRAARYFDRLNIDLIYGWSGQTWDMWRKDLERAVALPVDHVSLYHLTYEPKTPIGRAFHRGAIKAATDDELADFYEFASDYLASQGFFAYEVSNWCKPGGYCKQNINYWSGASYIGVGSGAHGYLAHQGPYGIRYHYPQRERRLKTGADSGPHEMTEAGVAAFLGVEIERERGAESWVLERLGSSLRSVVGFNLSAAEKKLGRLWQSSPAAEEALAQGKLSFRLIHDDRYLVLHPGQWFLEQTWAQVILEGWQDKAPVP